MILKIDTTNGILVEVRDEKKIIARYINTEKNKQSELLLLTINKALKKAGVKLGNIDQIEVANRGGSFTSLRIGIATANALGYALGIPVAKMGAKKGINNNKMSQVRPEYDREPNITIKNKI
jgi:tRNA threonylcarbamoyladenosine biosynthesis protein TsaB